MDPVKILKRAWSILWGYRALWVFGLVLALATAGSTSRGPSNSFQYEQSRGDLPAPQSIQEAFQQFGRELDRAFQRGIPDQGITRQEFSAFLWVIGGFFALMIVVGILVAIARYVSETAVIRMVDEYEASGSKMTVLEGLRTGWSSAAWRLFLINLIVSLPVILLILVLIFAGLSVYFLFMSGSPNLAVMTTVALIGFAFLMIFLVVILSILLRLLRNFFWRVCVLEGASVGESLRKGFALVRENWKNVGLMWLVMIGLGIVWAIASFLIFIITLPILFVTAMLAGLILAVPFLLLVGLFSLFLGGVLPWVAAALFMLPLFFVLTSSPWLIFGSWQTVYTSTVWTLTYREVKLLPALAVTPAPTPAGD